MPQRTVEDPDVEDNNPYSDKMQSIRELQEQEQTDAAFRDLTSEDHIAKDGQRPGDSSATSGSLEDKEGFTYSGKGSQTPTGLNPQSIMQTFRKKGPVAGIGALLVTGLIALLMPVIGPIGFFTGVGASLFETNDSVSPSMRRAFGAWMQKASEPDPMCNQKKIKCKMGRISNHGLNRLAKNGVVARFEDNTLYDSKNKKGYPDKKIKSYLIEGEHVDVKDIKKTLGSKGNFTKAAKIIGVRGAVNLKMSAFTGKHFDSKIRTNWNIRYKGGVATGRKAKATLAEKRAAIVQSSKASMPSMQTASAVKARASAKVEKNIGKYKKGGIGYLVAAGSCAALKAPMYIVGAVAALQLAQLTPVVVNTIYSPKDKMKSKGFDYGPGITEHDADVVGTAFNETGPNADGKMTSALDSKYMMAAMGISMGALGISKFAPGYGVLSHPTTRTAMKVNNNPGVSAGCNFITNPITMWSAAAVDVTVTALLSATIIGGILKVGLQWAASALVMEAIMAIVGNFADDLITELADEELILSARYEEFGDVVGTSAVAFGSSAGMARLLPVISESQSIAWNNVLAEQHEIDRQTDIASLSPFDTSSKYTFLGSIVHTIQMASILQGHTGIHIPSVLASAISPPRLFATAQAQSSDSNDLCNPEYGYADDLGMKTDDPRTTPIMNWAGMPCTGYIADMDIAEAVEILQEEGWIDEDLESDRDDLLLDELMPSGTEDNYQHGIGFIKKDTPLYEYINSCGNPDSGDHLMNTPGCILPQEAGGSGGIDGVQDAQICNDAEEKECRNTSDLDNNDEGKLSAEELGVTNVRAFEAISAFTLQYQIQQNFNGEDDGPVTTYTGPGGNSMGGEAGDGEGVVEGEAGSGGVAVTGTDQEVAQQIIDNPNITIANKYLYQVANYAKGNAGCHLDSGLLKVIAGIGQSHKIYVNSINRYCTNTCPQGNWAQCQQSHHWSGRAIDISMINEVATSGSKPADIALIKTAAQITPPDRRLIVGQKQCRSAIAYPSGSRVREINDGCDHIHLAVEAL